jgi:hypothetical protein
MVKRAHNENAKAIVVMCDLWSDFDSGQGRKLLPGDNASWVMYDAFVDNVAAKVTALGPDMLSTVLFEIWNEPARGFFWRGNDAESYQQYLRMWSRGFKRLRSHFPSALIVGPSIWGGSNCAPGTPVPDCDPNNNSEPLFELWLDEVSTRGVESGVVSRRQVMLMYRKYVRLNGTQCILCSYNVSNV